MKLYTVDTGLFKLDGGAMFGVVPKSIWNKLNPADENNMCSWAMRCLLIQSDKQLILIDTGIGNKQSIDFLKHFYLHGEGSLHKSLAAHGFTTHDVTDVVLTHLHFDHVGGAVFVEDETSKLTFPNAKYWTHSEHIEYALHPNAREKASFLAENILPIIESGRLNFLDKSDINDLFNGLLDFIFVDGHTRKQSLPLIKYKDKHILFAADLIPSLGHIPIPYVMSYDMQPLHTLEEKDRILKMAYEQGWLLFFEHDPIVELCTLKMTEKGIRAGQILQLNSV